jgi:hypothetical protein
MTEGVSNHFITSILEPTCEDFRGVFSADTIPVLQLLQYDTSSIVCNLSKVGERGSHFVTIICQPNRVLYIDSLGLPSLVPAINSFLLKFKKPIFCNSRQIQVLRLLLHTLCTVLQPASNASTFRVCEPFAK